jgi:hypothetical protein
MSVSRTRRNRWVRARPGGTFAVARAADRNEPWARLTNHELEFELASVYNALCEVKYADFIEPSSILNME